MLWNAHLDEAIQSLAFTKSQADTCVYFSWRETQLSIIAIYVDDILICSDTKSILKEIVEKVKSFFSIKDVGEISLILGTECMPNEKGTWLYQEMYITRLAERFKVNSGLVVNPIENWVPNYLVPEEESEEESNKNLYHLVIGGLLYLATCTRPDILYAIGNLSKFLNKPEIGKMKMAMRLLGYLMSTKKERIIYAKPEKPLLGIPDVELFCDPD
jgi:Reverse transcriptase (RNA-dependent DNA polymerase)